MISVLRTAVLEVSTVQIPSLRLLSTRPHCHADGNPYSQGLQLPPSLREDLAFLVPPGRQRSSAQGDQVRSHAHLSWKAGRDPLGMRKIYRAIPSRFLSSSGHGSGPAWVLGVFPGSSCCATLDLGQTLPLPTSSQGRAGMVSRPRGTGRSSKEAPWGGVRG